MSSILKKIPKVDIKDPKIYEEIINLCIDFTRSYSNILPKGKIENKNGSIQDKKQNHDFVINTLSGGECGLGTRIFCKNEIYRSITSRIRTQNGSIQTEFFKDIDPTNNRSKFNVCIQYDCYSSEKISIKNVVSIFVVRFDLLHNTLKRIEISRLHDVMLLNLDNSGFITLNQRTIKRCNLDEWDEGSFIYENEKYPLGNGLYTCGDRLEKIMYLDDIPNPEFEGVLIF